ncbi:hypothetical protein [Halobacterium sp. CBA1126]|uniref:hypothetical protein n=1 Tax=Halobacterium sp. CBA1126 TaxID=2668074 RepID=UPI0012F77B3E|nr:hypothetical protein [Halobacterium sp. CBA1126]MUV60033.1 hypothetical protein [Halobacterium sp. CBA1126]
MILLWIAVRMGGLFTGYGIGPPSVFLRVGIGYAALGLLTASLRPNTLRKAVLNAIATLAVIFVVGLCLMYYNLGLHPPESGTSLTLPRLLVYQIELTLVTLPVPAGYISGILLRERTMLEAAGVLLTAMLVGFAGGTWISLARGTAPGFTQLIFGGATLATTAFTLLPLGVMAWLDQDSPSISRPDTTGD